MSSHRELWHWLTLNKAAVHFHGRQRNSLLSPSLVQTVTVCTWLYQKDKCEKTGEELFKRQKTGV